MALAMRTLPRLAFACLFLQSAAFAADADAPANHNARLDFAIERLAQSSDADSLAAAGLLSSYRRREQSLPLLALASAAAPARVDLLWLHLQMCTDEASCDPEPLEKRLRELDGENGAGWFGAVARARKSGDESARLAALDAIAGSKRVDTYWTTLIARLSRAVFRAEAVSLPDAASAVTGVMAAISIPAYSDMSNPCRNEHLTRDGALERCRGIARSLMNGDTIITESVGVSIAKRAWPERSPEWLAASERKSTDAEGQRVQDWMLDNMSEFLALCEQHRREQDVFRAVRAALGPPL